MALTASQVTTALAAVGGVDNVQTVKVTYNSNLVDVGGSNVTSFNFDNANTLLTVTYQSGQVEVFGYDQIVAILGKQDPAFQGYPFYDIWAQVGKQWKP